MAAADGSETPVEAPPLMPPLTGLLAQAVFIESSMGADEHWFSGLSFSPESASGLEYYDICSTAALLNTDVGHGTANRRVAPFDLVLRDQCSTWGWTEAEYEARARRALNVKRHWGVDREFEKGELISDNLHLAETYTAPDPTTIALASGARVSPRNGLALLDEAIANSTAIIGRGMIHAPAFIIDLWQGDGLLRYGPPVEQDGPLRILSPMGNVIIAGTGYEGRGIDGTIPASHASMTAYATDWIVVVGSAPKTTPGSLTEATDKSRNLVTFRQDQAFAVLWAGLLHAAALIATDTPTVV